MNEKLLAVGGIVGAVAASSCCLAPLALVSVGISGAWIGTLTALAPWQPYFVAFAVACLGVGFWLTYRPSGQTCAAPAETRSIVGRLLRDALWVKGALWAGAALVAMSLGADYGAGLFL